MAVSLSEERDGAAPPRPTPFLRVLGGVDLRDARDADAGERLLAQQKHVALLALLALPRSRDGRPHHWRRDRLVGLLWPELSQERARNALSKALTQVRAALGADAIVTRGDEEVALAPDALGCDATLFQTEAEDGLLTRALERYRGDLLPGLHVAGCAELDRWVDAERAELQATAAGAAWALARRLEGDGALTDAARIARRAVRIAWDDERALRRAMGMLARLGDRAGALRLYDEFARRLRAEYDAEPSPETLAAAAELRA